MRVPFDSQREVFFAHQDCAVFSIDDIEQALRVDGEEQAVAYTGEA